MPIDREKRDRDFRAISQWLVTATHFALLLFYAWILSLALQLSVVRWGGFLSDNGGLIASILPIGSCLFLFWYHYDWLHPGRSFSDDIRGKGPSPTKDRQMVRAYLFFDAWQFLLVMAVGDVVGFVAFTLFHTQFFWAWGFAASGATGVVLWLNSYNRPAVTTKEKVESPTLIRGTLLNTFQAAVERSISVLAKFQAGKTPQQKRFLIRWAGIDLPGDIESHFALVGINGSGKTLALLALMRSVIPTIRFSDKGATARRALVFDPENKFIPFLQELAGEENVQILNPFDKRSRPWDLANDIEDLATAQEMASIFVPEQKGDSQPFWQRTSRGILSAVLKALHLRASLSENQQKKWTLRHVFHIVTNEERLTTVLRATNQTQGLMDLLKETHQTLFNVLAELRSHMDMLEIVAALWDNSTRELHQKPFTLKEWLDGQSVIVFGRPTQLEDTILALNRVLVKRASQLIRAPMPSEEAEARGRTWIFLDELRNIGNLPGLDKLLTEGRSRGARLAITFQDIDGLREVYSERIAEEIANQCDTTSYLRCRGTTAKWAAERIGRCEYWDKDFHTGSSTTYSQMNSTTQSSGSNTRKNLTDAVLESELSGLPTISKETHDGIPGGFIQGWHIVPAIECVYAGRERDCWYPFESMDGGSRFEKRDAKDQILRPWNDETDWAEIGVDRPTMPVVPITMPDVDSLRG